MFVGTEYHSVRLLFIDRRPMTVYQFTIIAHDFNRGGGDSQRIERIKQMIVGTECSACPKILKDEVIPAELHPA